MVTRNPDPESGTWTVKPNDWRASVSVPWAIVTVLSAGVGIAKFATDQPGQGLIGLAIPVLYYLLIRFVSRSIRLEITESVVRARQGGGNGHRDREVPRHDVLAIHYFPRSIGFRGPGDDAFLKIRQEYTLRQMKTVAEFLRVPLYTHERALGARGTSEGRLVYKPSESDRVP